MPNLNDIITDEDDNIADNLKNIESDSVDWDALDKLGFVNDFEKSANTFQESAESLKAQYQLRNFVTEKKRMSRTLADDIDETYKGLYSQKLIRESFTEEETLTNLKNTEVFMDGNISSLQDSTLTTLNDLFTKGLEVCETFYKFLRNDFQPHVLEKFNEQYTFIANSPSLVECTSILFLDDSKRNFVNTYDVPLKEFKEDKLKIIPDVDNPVDFQLLSAVVKQLDTLLEEYPKFATLVKMATDNNEEIPLNNILNTTLNYKDISIKDLFIFFRDRKGYFYLDNVPGLIDYVVNVITFKLNDYKGIMESNNQGPLTQYIFDVKDEVMEIQLALKFVTEYIKSVMSFISLSNNVFVLVNF